MRGAPGKSFPCPAAGGTVEDPTYPIRQKAFDALTAKDAEQARQLFRCAVKARQGERVALAQLVYLDIDAGDKPAAIQDIRELRVLHAQTKELELQLGYLYIDVNRLDLARQAFERALEYNDPAVVEKAHKALTVIAAAWPEHQLGFYLDSQFMTRFHDDVTDASLRYSERLGPRLPVSVYFNGRILRDTASHGGVLPQIYSDNAALVGAGLLYQPYRAHYFVSGEANEALLLTANAAGKNPMIPDYRAVAGYFRQWPEQGGWLHLEANGSMGFYSRYGNDGIAYLQPRELADLIRMGNLRLSAFVQENVALDTYQQYYNNTAELIPGLDLHDRRLAGLSLRCAFVRGYYLPLHSNSPNPYGPNYTDYRCRLILGSNMSLGTP